MKAWSSEKISTLALIMLITGAIDSIRNLPSAALFGSNLIFFFTISAVLFLLPVALVAAELSSTWSEEEGGIYNWVTMSFGETWGFLAVWLQWINTIVWYPTILSFIAGTLAYLIDPNLAHDKLYLFTIILLVFWSQTLIGMAGIHTTANFASFCTLFGMVVPMLAFIILAIKWLMQGNPIAINLDFYNLIPQWSNKQSWMSLTAIIASFLGMELAAVHVRNIKDPQKNFPRAVFISLGIILFTMILGALAIAIVIPANQINLVEGVPQAFNKFLTAYNLAHFLPVIVLMILIGSVGGMMNWIISPAKGLMLASNQGFLPKSLYKINKNGVPSRILLMQAILVTILASIFLLLPSINGIYWLLTDLSTELYVIMYVLMFFAAIKIKNSFHKKRAFQIPGGRVGYYFTCSMGLLGCFVTLGVGFINPGSQMNYGNYLNFQEIFAMGILLLLMPYAILVLCKKFKK